jgi:hypothetical protein
MLALGVRDLGLATEFHALHGNSMRGIDVRPDHERPMRGKHLIRAKGIRGGADLAAAKTILGNAEEQQEVLHQANRRGLGKDCEDVEAEGGGEFETGQEQYLAQQPAKLAKPGSLFWREPVQRFQQFEVFDFTPKIGVAAHRVVIGKGNDVKFSLFGLF